jgi:hypothetical protein
MAETQTQLETVNPLPLSALWNAFEAKDRDKIAKLAEGAILSAEQLPDDIRKETTQLLKNIKVHAGLVSPEDRITEGHWHNMRICLDQLFGISPN